MRPHPRKPPSAACRPSKLRVSTNQPPRKPIQPLPIWCHPEFNAFMESYRDYVDHQITTFLILSDIVKNNYTLTTLLYWKSVRKSLKHISWAATRKNDI